MDNRRSTRVSAVLPIMLSGIDSEGVPFNENAWTIGVNKHGAKLSTSRRLAAGDQVMVGNSVLRQLAQARVTRVMKEGGAFEIGVELLDPQDVWGAKTPPPDWGELNSSGVGDQGFEPASDRAEANSGTEPNGPPTGHAQQGAERLGAGGNGGAISPAPHFESLTDFLRACRTELKGLLAEIQQIQQKSYETIQSLFEQVHVRWREELEGAAANFVNATSKRIQEEATIAFEVFGREANARKAGLVDEVLAQSHAARQQIELSLKEGAEEYQRRLADLSASTFEDFQQRAKTLFEGFRTELEKTVEDLKKQGMEEVSDRLRDTSLNLADELRRRAEVGFEILNEQLGRSGKAVVEETQRQVASLRESALTDLGKEASDTVQQHVAFGASGLKESADRTRVDLEAYFQQSVETFQKRLEELSSVGLQKYRGTSEFLLGDLQSRLDQAARALQQASTGQATGPQQVSG